MVQLLKCPAVAILLIARVRMEIHYSGWPDSSSGVSGVMSPAQLPAILRNFLVENIALR